MKKLTIIGLLCSTTAFSQGIEFYGGPRYSRHIWTPNFSLANSKNYQTTVAYGLAFGLPDKNWFGKNRLLEFAIAFEYSPYRAFGYRMLTETSSESSWMKVHRLRGAIPIRLNAIDFADDKFTAFVLGSPGYNLALWQSYDNWDDNPRLAKTLDFSLDVGIGLSYKAKKPDKEFWKTREKKRISSDYYLSSISVWFSRSFDFDPAASSALGTGNLHQYALNVGVKLTPKPRKLIRFNRRRDKTD